MKRNTTLNLPKEKNKNLQPTARLQTPTKQHILPALNENKEKETPK
jgi:hypothetical protein